MVRALQRKICASQRNDVFRTPMRGTMCVIRRLLCRLVLAGLSASNSAVGAVAESQVVSALNGTNQNAERDIFVPTIGALRTTHLLSDSLAAVPTDGTTLRPSVFSCAATNCFPANPSVAVIWVEGETTRGAQAEALLNLGWTIKTGAGNSQKPAVFMGAAQTEGGGSAWALNTDIVRGCVPGGANSFAHHTGSCTPTKHPGGIGKVNSTIGYEADFTNWDEDGLLGQGPFTVGIYVHNASVYASSAAMYFDSEAESPGQRNAAWHVGIGFYNPRTVLDSTLYDGTNSNTTINVEGNHFAALSTTAANLSYAAILKAGQSACFDTLRGCLRYEKSVPGLVYAPEGNTAKSVFSVSDKGDLTIVGKSALSDRASLLKGVDIRGGLVADKVTTTLTFTPKSGSSPCSTGDMVWDKIYEYRCVSPDHWQRTKRSDF